MRLDPSLNVTPEESLVDLPAAVGNMAGDREERTNYLRRDYKKSPLETANMGISDTCVKTKPESIIREAPKIIQRAKEVNREEAIAST